MATFVLTPGAYHGAWCWERLTPLLEARGHRVLAPDPLGMGADPTPLEQVTLAGWADQIAGLVAAQDEPVVLVGHSRGGIIISEVAERVPDRVRTLVYLSAILASDGESLGVAVGRFRRDDTPSHRTGVAGEASLALDPGIVADRFYNTTEPAWTARALALLGPEPAVVFDTPLKLSAGRFGRVPRAYIECARDNALPPYLQQAMQGPLPCDPVISLDCDHSPFFSCPEDLADALCEIARG